MDIFANRLLHSPCGAVSLIAFLEARRSVRPLSFGDPIDPCCKPPLRRVSASSAFHESGRMPEPWFSLRSPAPDASALPFSPSRPLAVLPFPLLATPLPVCRSLVFVQGALSLLLVAQHPKRTRRRK